MIAPMTIVLKSNGVTPDQSGVPIENVTSFAAGADLFHFVEIRGTPNLIKLAELNMGAGD